jgi:CubicO group peptidase (beta-lactamase class C family)
MDGGGFGFGGRVITADTRGANDSLGSYGWGGAAGTQFWMDPVKGAVVVGMIWIMPSETYPLRKELREALTADAG